MIEAAAVNGVQLLSGHTHSLDAPIEAMAKLIRSGELGQPLMINTSYYKNFIFRPFSDEQLAASHGVVLDQGPHQIDIVRLLGGGMVRSVRALSAIGTARRPAEGHFVCYLEFESGLPAMLLFSGYAYLDSAELVWGIGEGGTPAAPESFVAAHRFWRELDDPDRDRRVAELIDSWRYGGDRAGEWFFQGRSKAPTSGERHQPFFGVTIVSCQGGDVRQSPDGLFVYTAEGRREIPVSPKATGRAAEMRELFDAVNGQPPVHDGRWGLASLEVALAILESSNSHCEVRLSHQIPVA
jgi:phthalate 4,5-cis-dihydrodiol dehydrogenase